MEKRKWIKIMATIKSYTDLEQSKKLAEILPIESADMCWTKYIDNGDVTSLHVAVNYGIVLIDYPCWSLAALLDILKYPSLNQDVGNKWSITDWTGHYPKSEYGFDSPVDACYNMIIHLHELNLL